MTRNRNRVALAVGLWVLTVCQVGRADDTQVLFAFDDHAIPWHHNTKVTLVQAEKHPENPVVRTGPKGSPDFGHAIMYGSVLHIDGKFRMWYLGMTQREIVAGQAPGYWRPMCYAESKDGIHWTKPDLGLVEFNGNKKNNICLVESDPHSLSLVDDFLSILHDPDDPDPARRYKAAYIAHLPFEEVKGGRTKIGPHERRWGSFVCATSPDGLSWRVDQDRPTNAGGERFEVSGLYRFGDFYYATGQLVSPWIWQADGREVGRVMLTYRSPDFREWSRAKAFAFARPGQTLAEPVPGQQTHMGAGLWNRGNALVGLYGMWQDGPKDRPKGKPHLFGMRIDLGLILSNDGIHFREPVPGFKVIERGKEGEWDSISLLQAHAFANVGSKTYLWYSHWDNDGQFRNQEIGLATLRRDGFGYLSRKVDDQDGHCISTNLPGTKSGYRLRVNVDGVSDAHPLGIEVLDRLGRPIPGFSGKDRALVVKSGVDQVVEFPRAEDQRTPREQPIAIRANFPASGNVRLFALYADAAAGDKK